MLICGLGDKGCALADKNGIRYFQAVEMASPVTDTNGAGDCLAAGFLSGRILENYSIEDSILRGQIAARWVCSQKGGSSNLMTKRIIEKYL